MLEFLMMIGKLQLVMARNKHGSGLVENNMEKHNSNKPSFNTIAGQSDQLERENKKTGRYIPQKQDCLVNAQMDFFSLKKK